MAEAENKRQRRTRKRERMNWMKKSTKINQSINELGGEKENCCRRVRCEDHRSKGTHQISGGKKAEILAPKAPRKPRKTKKQKIQEIVKLAMKNGMSVEEVASQLHVEVES